MRGQGIVAIFAVGLVSCASSEFGRSYELGPHRVVAPGLEVGVLLHTRRRDTVVVDFFNVPSSRSYAHYSAPYETEWKGFYRKFQPTDGYSVAIRWLELDFGCGGEGAAAFYADDHGRILSVVGDDGPAHKIWTEDYASGTMVTSSGVQWAWRNAPMAGKHLRRYGRVVADSVLLQIGYFSEDTEIDETLLNDILSSVKVTAPDADDADFVARLCPQ